MLPYEVVSFPGQLEPGIAVALDHDPLLHQASVPGIEILAIVRLDEIANAIPGELHDEALPDEHGKDLLLHLERVRAESSRPSGRLVGFECPGDRREPRIRGECGDDLLEAPLGVV